MTMNKATHSCGRKFGGLVVLIALLMELHPNWQSLHLQANDSDPLSLLPSNHTYDQQYLTSSDSKDDGRSLYGYRRPRPPFEPIKHTSHNCTITDPSGKKDSRKVHIPIAVPNLILIGAQKSGTSTVQVVFSSQPNIIKPSKKRTFEPHFFDRDMELMSNKRQFFHENNTSESILCKYREDYSEFYDLSNMEMAAGSSAGNAVAFEKTPSYMLYPVIPAAIDAVCPWKPKILAILRNPIDRAWSQYGPGGNNKAVKTGRTKTKVGVSTSKAFIGLVNKEIREFVKSGILEKATLTFEQFERSGDTASNPFHFPGNMTLHNYAQRVRDYTGSRSTSLLYRGLYAPLLLPWVEQFAMEDRLMVLEFKQFIQGENEGNRTLANEVLGFAGLTDYHYHTTEEHSGIDNIGYGNGNEDQRRQNSTDDENGNREKRQRRRSNNAVRRKLVWENQGESSRAMPPRMRQYLKMLYQPFNDLLPDLLGEEWRNIWH